MAATIGVEGYVPGTYAKRKPGAEELVGHYVRIWEGRQAAREATDRPPAELPPCITFSRKIGVGALEIADLTAQMLDCRVADRELIEQIASQAGISDKATAYFDERFPGYVNRTFKYLFGEKAFIDSDYSRHLISAVFAIAGSERTVFVGNIDPRGVLAEFGVTLPDETEVRVWDSTAEIRYLVLPERPAGTEGMSEEELAALVTRDSMIGTDRLEGAAP